MLKHLPELIKYKLSMAVTVTCISGYLLYEKNINREFFVTVISVFLLASGMSALNQYQERVRDTKMQRTSNRPVPSGQLNARSALYVSVILVISGLTGLLYISPMVFLIAIISVILYNILYTYLKPVTYLSIIPGSMVGAIPPIIGWTAAGGEPGTPQVLFLSSLIFIWQVPHFWMLIIKYRKEYNTAGYPTILDKMPEIQLRRIVFLWISISCLLVLAWPLFGIRLIPFLSYFTVSAILVFLVFFYLLSIRRNRLKTAFIISNTFILLLYVIFATGSLSYEI